MLVIQTVQTLTQLAQSNQPDNESIISTIITLSDLIRSSELKNNIHVLSNPTILEIAAASLGHSPQHHEALSRLMLSVSGSPDTISCFIDFFDNLTPPQSTLSDQLHLCSPGCDMEVPFPLLILNPHLVLRATDPFLHSVSTAASEICTNLAAGPNIDLVLLVRNLLQCPQLTMWCILSNLDILKTLFQTSAEEIQMDVRLPKLATYAITFMANHPNIIFAAYLLRFKGAEFFIDKYPSPVLTALREVHGNPCKLMVDLLTQGMSFTFLDFPILPHLVSIATREIMLLATKNKAALYVKHNTSCRTTSLFASLCDLSVLIIYNLLCYSGKDASFLTAIRKLLLQNSLPPTAKPNYFCVPASFNGILPQAKVKAQIPDLSSLQALYEIEDVNLLAESLVYCVEAILHVMAEEIFANESGPSQSLQTLRLEKVFGTVIAAFAASSIFDDNCSLASIIKSTSTNVAKSVIENCAESKSKCLAWVTLFNFANDVCYADISLAAAVMELLDQLSCDELVSGEFELVRSALELFFFTFDDGSQVFENILKLTLRDTSANTSVATVPSSKFAFLYEDTSKSTKRERRR